MKTRRRTPPETPPADAPVPADILRVNRKTIYEAVQRGELPGVLRIGRTLRFVRDLSFASPDGPPRLKRPGAPNGSWLSGSLR